MSTSCIVNIGLYRTGTTTLAHAAKKLNLKIYREFPDLCSEMHKLFLHDSQEEMDKILLDVEDELIERFQNYDLVCDGYFPLFALASSSTVEKFKREATKKGVDLVFLATERSKIESYLRSELHHWILHDIERKCGLEERSVLEEALLTRFHRHQQGLKNLEIPSRESI